MLHQPNDFMNVEFIFSQRPASLGSHHNLHRDRPTISVSSGGESEILTVVCTIQMVTYALLAPKPTQVVYEDSEVSCKGAFQIVSKAHCMSSNTFLLTRSLFLDMPFPPASKPFEIRFEDYIDLASGNAGEPNACADLRR